ncbi:hypothetical protein TI01_2284 [Lysobacter sp. A03]|nr:hypothetical protein TI01_2284 [Lysobacter sp. A03]
MQTLQRDPDLVLFDLAQRAERGIADHSNHVAHGARTEQRQLDVARLLPAPHAQGLAEVLAAAIQLGVAGRIENAGDAKCGVEHEPSQGLSGLAGLSLQKSVDGGDRLAEVAEEIAHSQPHRARRYRHVEPRQRSRDRAIDRVVEAVHRPVVALPRVVNAGHLCGRRQGGVGDGIIRAVQGIKVALGGGAGFQAVRVLIGCGGSRGGLRRLRGVLIRSDSFGLRWRVARRFHGHIGDGRCAVLAGLDGISRSGLTGRGGARARIHLGRQYRVRRRCRRCHIVACLRTGATSARHGEDHAQAKHQRRCTAVAVTGSGGHQEQSMARRWAQCAAITTGA